MRPRFVVDASVVLKWLLPEPHRDRSLALLSRYTSGEVVLIAPAHLPMEVASALTRLSRRKILSRDQVRDAFRFFRRLEPAVMDSGPTLFTGIELALAHQLSLWDSLYLALSVAEQCPLITADRWLYRAVGPAFPSVRFIGDPLS